MGTSGEETDQDILAPDYSPNPSTSDFLAKIIDKVTFGLVTFCCCHDTCSYEAVGWGPMGPGGRENWFPVF